MFNLRGNQRTSGELSRKEGGKIFGSGSRTPISITILVRKPNHTGSAAIHYEAVADYLSREEKLALVSERGSMLSDKMRLSSIAPNEAGDWINQRDGLFETFLPLECEGKFNTKSSSVFCVNSRGLETARDSWVYNSSLHQLTETTQRMVAFYNEQVSNFANRKERTIAAKDFITYDPTKISWSTNLIEAVQKGATATFEQDRFSIGMYRPFFKQHVYRGEKFINRRGQFDQFFPTPQSKNLVICTSGHGGTKDFSCFITDIIPDVNMLDAGTQCFPLYFYEENARDALSLFDNGSDDYTRHSGLTDFILQRAREEFGPKVSAEDVFYYVYGILHSVEYRKRFSSDLKKTLARIPIVDSPQDFKAFVKAGRKLADLHLNYETGPLCQQLIITGDKSGKLNVAKMRFPSKEDKGTILFNDSVRIENIPMTAYDYVVNGKSAVEWVMERYAVTKNTDSGIVNDPNLWSANPRYILDLVSRVIQMSVDTQKIVAGLPKLDFSSQKS